MGPAREVRRRGGSSGRTSHSGLARRGRLVTAAGPGMCPARARTSGWRRSRREQGRRKPCAGRRGFGRPAGSPECARIWQCSASGPAVCRTSGDAGSRPRSEQDEADSGLSGPRGRVVKRLELRKNQALGSARRGWLGTATGPRHAHRRRGSCRPQAGTHLALKSNGI